MGDTLEFRRPDGRPTSWEVELEPPAQSKNFRTRRGTYKYSGDQSIPFAVRYARGGEGADRAVENAIGTGLRMLRRYEADRHYPWEENGGGWNRYPWELSRLLGYNVDCAEPFVITMEFGVPLNQLTSPLSPDDVKIFAAGLARGMYLLGNLDIVHRQLRDNTLHWDSRNRLVQINRFEYARLVGDARSRLFSDWASPEQKTGGGLVEVRDDVFSAGHAIMGVTAYGFRKHPDLLRRSPDGRPDPAASEVHWLPDVLASVFGPVAQRPDAAELMRRLGQTDVPARPPVGNPDNRLAPGWREFDRLMAGKRGLPPPTAQPRTPPPATPPPPPRQPDPPRQPEPPWQSNLPRQSKRSRRNRGRWSPFTSLPPSFSTSAFPVLPLSGPPFGFPGVVSP